MPRPFFVVKSGSKTCFSVSGDIPQPVSVTAIRTKRSEEGRSPTGDAEGSQGRTLMRSVPPPGMASRALDNKLTIACCSSSETALMNSGSLRQASKPFMRGMGRPSG